MSRTPEGKVKDYLKARVEALSGETRFTKWVGRRNAPDIRVMFAPASKFYGCNCWVETKAKAANGSLSSGQVREIQRMQGMGETVLVLLSKEDIDREFPL